LARRRRAAAALLILVLCNAAYALLYEINEDKDAYYITTFMAAALAAGTGLAVIMDGLVRKGWKRAGDFAPLSLLLPVALLVIHWPDCDRSRDHRAGLVLAQLDRELPDRALVLTMEWQVYSPWLYQRHVENFRPDLTIIDVNLMRRTWYLEYLQRVYPAVMTEVKDEAAAFLELLWAFEYDQPYDAGMIQKRYLELLQALIAAGLRRGGGFVMLPMEQGVGTGLQWVPWGLTYRMLTVDQPLPAPSLLKPPPIHSWLYGKSDLGGKKLRWLYGFMSAQQARWFHEHDRPEAAARLASQGLSLVKQGEPYPGK
ncbi:hypothetical protein JW905_09935, partial [bacterium]|nr:hypothetical protein [candidate division CSSED10-310 bacterium]